MAFIWLLHRVGLGNPESVRLLPEPTQRLLREADAVEVFSLGGATERNTAFQGADILGSVVVEERSMRRRLTRRILLANRFNTGGFLCLGAEYGIRVRSRETTIDLTFCFDCYKVWVDGPAEHRGMGTVAPLPVPLLKRILKKAGVPLPPPQRQ